MLKARVAGKIMFCYQRMGQLSSVKESRRVPRIMWGSLTGICSEEAIVNLSFFHGGNAHKANTSFAFSLCLVTGLSILHVLFRKVQQYSVCKLTTVLVCEHYGLCLTLQFAKLLQATVAS